MILLKIIQIGEVHGPLTANGANSLTLIIDDVPQLRELLKQYPTFKVINRRRQVIIGDNIEQDPESSYNSNIDGNAEKENEIVNQEDILTTLESNKNTSIAEVVQYHSNRDEKLHLSFELRIVKSTITHPLCWYLFLMMIFAAFTFLLMVLAHFTMVKRKLT